MTTRYITWAALISLAAVLGTPEFALADDAKPSVAEGERLSVIGGCQDCHTAGYSQSHGIIDPATALKGNPVGFQGDWGTTYAGNLRTIVASTTEAYWVVLLSNLSTNPPMPWYNLPRLSKSEMQSLFEYIKSLGNPGDSVPSQDVPSGHAVHTPYIVLTPVNPGS